MAKKTAQKPITVGFMALGCPKNIVDSEKMLGKIAEANLVITAEPYNADVVVINTCGFIAPARDEALQAIRLALDCKAAGKVKKVIVAGCLCERLGTELFNQVDGIDAIVGLGQRDAIGRIIKETFHCDKSAAYLEAPSQTVANDRARLLITPGHWAYLRISEGCDHRCSYCTVPAIRGRFRSKPQREVLAEAAELARAGVVELNVIGQDTTHYGRDLKIKDGLSKLLGELQKIAGLVWIRLMYLYPAGITNELIETLVKSKKTVHYIDMPIQHINDRILKDMRRPDTKERIYSLVENLRDNLPDIVLRTTVIVGFPGETDQQFNELLEFIRWAKFDCLGSFRYYPESGTPAAEMPNQVPDQIKQQRVEELMLTQQKIVFAKNRERIGSKLACLVDSVDNKLTCRARFYGQAPDIDTICIIKNCSAQPGQFIDAKVTTAKDYDLIVKQI